MTWTNNWGWFGPLGNRFRTKLCNPIHMKPARQPWFSDHGNPLGNLGNLGGNLWESDCEIWIRELSKYSRQHAAGGRASQLIRNLGVGKWMQTWSLVFFSLAVRRVDLICLYYITFAESLFPGHLKFQNTRWPSIVRCVRYSNEPNASLETAAPLL